MLVGVKVVLYLIQYTTLNQFNNGVGHCWLPLFQGCQTLTLVTTMGVTLAKCSLCYSQLRLFTRRLQKLLQLLIMSPTIQWMSGEVQQNILGTIIPFYIIIQVTAQMNLLLNDCVF